MSEQRKAAPSQFPEEPKSETRLKVTALPIAYPEGFERPKTEGDCPREWREDHGCPLVGCKWNTFLDVRRDGSIKWNFRGVDCPTDLPHTTCAIELAERHPTLEQCGEAMNVTKERVRQIEMKAARLFLRRKSDLDGDAMPRTDMRPVKPASIRRKVLEMIDRSPGISRHDVIDAFGSEASRRSSVQTIVSALIRTGVVRSVEGRLWGA